MQKDGSIFFHLISFLCKLFKNHPFERLLTEMEVKHRYAKPYRPQTNGKIEHFWKILHENFIEDTLYEDVADMRNELLGFLVYYNEHQPHSAIRTLAPLEKSQNM